MRYAFTLFIIFITGCSSSPRYDSTSQVQSRNGVCQESLSADKLDAGTPQWVLLCILSTPAPVLPPEAVSAGIGGDVSVNIHFDAAGRVEGIDVLKSPSDLLSSAVVSAVLTWRVRPLNRDGRAVGFIAHQTFSFVYE